MKKNIVIMILGVLFALVSCSQETKNLSEMQQITTFNVSNQVTRSSIINPTRYIMEVYDKENNPVYVFENGTTHHKKQESPSFSVVLDRTQEYICLFWADGDESGTIYDITNLRAVKLNENKTPIEGFCAVQQVSGNIKNYSITLGRTVGKVVLKETDIIKEESQLSVTYKRNSEFNVMTGVAMTPESFSHTIEIPVAIDASDEKLYILGEFYTFASIGQNELVDFTFTLNNESPRSLSNVPLQANYQTNIIGEYSAITTKAFTIITDNNWNEYQDLN